MGFGGPEARAHAVSQCALSSSSPPALGSVGGQVVLRGEWRAAACPRGPRMPEWRSAAHYRSASAGFWQLPALKAHPGHGVWQRGLGAQGVRGLSEGHRERGCALSKTLGREVSACPEVFLRGPSHAATLFWSGSSSSGTSPTGGSGIGAAEAQRRGRVVGSSIFARPDFRTRSL